MARPAPLATRVPAALALAIPAVAGLVYLGLAGAPASYPIVNGVCLLAGVVWIALGRGPGARGAFALATVLLAVFALPLATGPEIDGIARWVPLGPLTLHAGMLVLPALAVLCAEEDTVGPALLLACAMIALLQPDAASALATAGAALGSFAARRRKLFALVGVASLAAAYAALRADNLPPQPFVERVIVDAAGAQPVLAAVMALALAASAALIVRAGPSGAAPRVALAGTLVGFVAASVIGDFPTPLVGYGASAILGYAVALGLRRSSAR